MRNTSTFCSKTGRYEKVKERSNQAQKLLRESLFEILGKRCVKCGFNDPRILQIDHIKGGGVRELKKFGSSYSMWKFYLSNQHHISTNLQILCPNCNWIKRMENDENRK